MADRFTKMHGLGNDFVVIDARLSPVELTPHRVAGIANRNEGIGCDQLIVIEPSERADVSMRIYNADGSTAEACGNAARCVAQFVGGAPSIETPGGRIAARDDGSAVRVDMGVPRFEWQDIPLAYAMDTASMPVGWEDLRNPAAVNVGNPHVVFIVPDADAAPLDRLGPMIERDPLFPEGVNVGIAQIDGNAIRLRVWERGAGLTRACGTGACAAAVVAVRRGLISGPVDVILPGGTLQIDWAEGRSISMSGPATRVFDGTTSWERFG